MKASETLDPSWTTTLVAAGAYTSVGATNFTVKANDWFAVNTIPVVASVRLTLKFTVAFPPSACGLPVKVSLNCIELEDKVVGLVNVAVTPAGSPETTADVQHAPPACVVTPGNVVTAIPVAPEPVDEIVRAEGAATLIPAVFATDSV